MTKTSYNEKLVLLVDDDNDYCETLQFDFTRQGFKTLTANGGTQALALFQTHSIDLVVTDVQMPDGDGLSLLKSIRAIHPKNPPVIVITASHDVTEAAVLEQGAVALFRKPYPLPELMNAVHDALFPMGSEISLSDREIDKQFFHSIATPLSIARGMVQRNIDEMKFEIDLSGPAAQLDRLEKAVNAISKIELLYIEYRKNVMSRKGTP